MYFEEKRHLPILKQNPIHLQFIEDHGIYTLILKIESYPQHFALNSSEQHKWDLLMPAVDGVWLHSMRAAEVWEARTAPHVQL